MKIGVFSNYYPPTERGGAELVAQRVADELSRRGHEVFVLSTMPFFGLRSLVPRQIAYHVERIYRFFPLNIYHASNASDYPFPVRLLWHVLDALGPFPLKQIDRLIDKEEPDLILTHNIKGLGLRVSRSIQKAGVKHIHTLHDIQLSVPSGVMNYGDEKKWMQTGFARRWYECLTKYALGKPDLVISPSQFLADFYRERGFFLKTPVCVLPNPAPMQLNDFEHTQLLSGPIRFFFVGQLEPHKGLLLLLEAVEQLQVPFELHIAGDGSLASQMVRRAGKDPRVFYHGFISLEHINKIMVRSDAVVLPSLCYENSPTVLYESFQMGVPVIASAIGGIPERIVEGENGMLVEPGSVSSLHKALERFVEARATFAARREEIRQQAKQYALARYVDELEKLF